MSSSFDDLVRAIERTNTDTEQFAMNPVRVTGPSASDVPEAPGASRSGSSPQTALGNPRVATPALSGFANEGSIGAETGWSSASEAASLGGQFAALTGSAWQGQGNPDVERLASMMQQLRETSALQVDGLKENTQAVAENTQHASRQGGGVSNILSSVFSGAFSLGLSPLITGIMDLFGGGGSSPSIAMPKFTLPRAIGQEAGVTANNSIVPIAYGTDGMARNASGPAPQITLNINAMDSQSFLDRSGDIAAAVKQAMLHSHPLNDLVTDL